MEVVVEGAAFAQEFGGEEEVVGAQGGADTGGVADRDGGFDHHDGLGVDGDDVADHGLDGGGVEVVGFGVVVGGGGDDDVVGVVVGVVCVECGAQVQGFVAQEVFDLGVFDRGFAAVELGDFLGDDVEGDDVVVLGE